MLGKAHLVILIYGKCQPLLQTNVFNIAYSSRRRQANQLNIISWAHHTLFVVCVIIFPSYLEIHSLSIIFHMARPLKKRFFQNHLLVSYSCFQNITLLMSINNVLSTSMFLTCFFFSLYCEIYTQFSPTL